MDDITGIIGVDPTPEEKKATAEAIDREENEAFDKLELSSLADDEPSQPRDDSGKFAKADKPDETETTNETDEPSDSEVEGGAEKPDTDDDELRKARANLVLDGWKEHELKDLTDEQIISRAERAVQNRGEKTRLQQELAELRRRVDGQETDEADEDSNAAPPDLLKAVEPHLDSLREYYGEDDAVNTTINAVVDGVKSLSDELSAKIQQQETALRELQTIEKRRELDAAFTKHAEAWNLGDEARKSQVFDLMKKLDVSGAFGSMDELMSAACKQLYADERITELSSNLASEHKHRANGQPTPAGKRATKPALSAEDEEDQLIDAILDRDEDRVQRLSRKMGSGGKRQSLSEMMSKNLG